MYLHLGYFYGLYRLVFISVFYCIYLFKFHINNYKGFLLLSMFNNADTDTNLLFINKNNNWLDPGHKSVKSHQIGYVKQ